MKDLEILVPAETAVEKIAIRLLDFKKWGLINHDNYQIKLIFATSRDNIADYLKEDWPENIEVDILQTPYKQVAQRIHHYYSQYIKPNTAKWYLRVDEDSITDIKGLMNNLESLFDHERDYHIVGELLQDMDPAERQIFKSLGYDWWHNGAMSLGHEYEVSVTSNRAIERIFSNPKSLKFFNTRKEIASGAGDHGLAYCARMEKIYCQQVRFLTKEPKLTKFSLFGGVLNHIHYVSRDTNPTIIDWLETCCESENIEAFEKYKNKNYFFSRTKEPDKKWIRLNSNKTVEIINKKEILGIWGTNKNGNLCIFLNNLSDNNPMLVFDDTKTISSNYELLSAD